MEYLLHNDIEKDFIEKRINEKQYLAMKYLSSFNYEFIPIEYLICELILDFEEIINILKALEEIGYIEVFKDL